MSLIEALANVAVGFVLAVLMQRAVFPVFGIANTLATDLVIGAMFTTVSVARAYVMRRLFERLGARRDEPPRDPPAARMIGCAAQSAMR